VLPPPTTPGAGSPAGKPPEGTVAAFDADAEALELFDCETAPTSPGSL
jgi:hypothetical protein